MGFLKPPEYQKGKMTPADCVTKGCVFCKTTDPKLHVRFCGGCQKCICDSCRPRYTMRAAAAADEKWSQVTKAVKRIL